jgi:transketolase
MTSNDLDARAINTIRALAMDLPEQARSGHQGTAMALAPLAHVLWTRIMNYDAEAPEWFDRDRFVLSAGHASVLLYSMLHLTGYDLSLDDLRPSGSGARGRPATPSGVTPPASRSPPVPSARASATAWAWASPRPTCGPGSAPSCATTTPS